MTPDRSSQVRTHLCVLLLSAIAVAASTGCGTTRWTDTSRTATEQMLISDAVERAIAQIDFGVLQGRSVFLDTSFMEGTVDHKFIASTLRQHMLACGCAIRESKADAEFIVEARAGAVGTDRHDLLYGVPAINLGGITPVPGVPTAIPEIALARRTDQRAVAKLAVFAYHRESGRPVWQSGSDPVASKARDLWVFGAGPFQRGTIYDGTQFAGGDIAVPLVTNPGDEIDATDPMPVTMKSTFNSPTAFSKPKPAVEEKPADVKVAANPPKPTAPAPAPAPAPQQAPTVAGPVVPAGGQAPVPAVPQAPPPMQRPIAPAANLPAQTQPQRFAPPVPGEAVPQGRFVAPR